MGSNVDPEGLVDLIYETAVEPELWPTVLERLADLVGGDGAILMWQHQLTGDGVGVAARVDPDAPRAFFEHFAARNPLRPAAEVIRRDLTRFFPRIILDEDRLPKSELMRTEFYNDFMRPFDFHSTLSVGLACEGLYGGTVDVLRPMRRGAFSSGELQTARRLQPHLVRAFGLGRKLSGRSAVGQDLADALDQSPHGLIIADPDGRIRHANRPAEDLLRQGAGLTVFAGRIVATTADASRRLAGLVRSAGARDGPGTRGGSMSLAAPPRRLPLALSVTPLHAERFAVFAAGPAVLITLTDLEAPVDLPAPRLREMFGLSRAEARVAQALFDGLDPREAAQRLSLSVYTVRGHLARIFDKTGVHGQVELTRLMMRLI
jgi:DNA-binding CsgD family transcriptional regulator/PAS domain-containing protein